MKIEGIDKAGKKKQVEVSVKSETANSALIHQVIRVQQLSRRKGSAATKTRADVSGGGKKPWRQKGTGRARIGSIRAPHWTGGGVVFCPHPRDWSKRLNKKMKKAALVDALSARFAENSVFMAEEINVKDGRTKEALAMLNSLGISGKTLLVSDNADILIRRAFSNLDAIVVDFRNLNVEDVVWAKNIVFDGTCWDNVKELVAE